MTIIPLSVTVEAEETVYSDRYSNNGAVPARPEWLLFDSADPGTNPLVLLPQWHDAPAFTEHSYRTLAADELHGEAILFQNTGYSHSEWAFRDRDGNWRAGQLDWPAYAREDLAPFGASHARVNYPVVVLRDRAVHFCGCVSYDNWDRVRTVADMGLGEDPNRPGAPGTGGRRLGHRMRRLLYTWTPEVGDKPFADWIEIANTQYLIMKKRHFDLEDRLVDYAVRIIRLSEALSETKAGRHVSTQISMRLDLSHRGTTNLLRHHSIPPGTSIRIHGFHRLLCAILLVLIGYCTWMCPPTPGISASRTEPEPPRFIQY